MLDKGGVCQTEITADNMGSWWFSKRDEFHYKISKILDAVLCECFTTVRVIIDSGWYKQCRVWAWYDCSRQTYVVIKSFHKFPKKITLDLTRRSYGPRQANLVLIAYASSEDSGEPAHSRSLARTFAARSCKKWVKWNLQTESQIPSPSEWLGMRS